MIVNGISTATLAALSAAVSMRFNMGMGRPVTPYDFLAMTIPSTRGEQVYPYLKEFGFIREWLGDRQIQNLATGDFRVVNKTYEQTHSIPREAVADDSFGLYGPMFEQTGQNVAAFPAEQVYTLLRAGFTTLGPDGQFFFDTDHPVGAGVVSNTGGGSGEPWFVIDGSKVVKPLIWQPRQDFNLVRMFDDADPNVFWQKAYVWGVDGRAGVGYSPFWQLAYGSRSTLDATALTAALTALAIQKGDTGRPLGIRGTHLVVGPALGELARSIINMQYLSGGAQNPLFQRLQVVEAHQLA
jgi:phage major head subunit gpT-like protein